MSLRFAWFCTLAGTRAEGSTALKTYYILVLNDQRIIKIQTRFCSNMLHPVLPIRSEIIISQTIMIFIYYSLKLAF